jgi:hypothetical protein
MLEETPLQYATLCGLYVPKAHTSKLFSVLTAQGIGHSIVGTSSSIVLTCVTPDMDFGAVAPEGMESGVREANMVRPSEGEATRGMPYPKPSLPMCPFAASG